MAQVEQALYFVIAGIVGASSVCKGNVLNIGLGEGISARAFLWSRYINTVTSVETNAAQVTAYRALYPANEFLELNRHTIRTGDAATLPANQFVFPYDFVYVDTLEAYDTVIYNKLRDIAVRLALPGVLAAGGAGKVCVQWQGDVQVERQARQWMEDNGWIAQIVRPEVAFNAWARGAQMLVYHR